MKEIFNNQFIYVLIFIFVSLLSIREYVTYKKNLDLKYIFTPLVTLSIILFIIYSVSLKSSSLYTTLILIGLILSLIADTILMINEIDLIKHGLIFFLLAHILYVIAFGMSYSFNYYDIFMIIFLAIFFWFFFNKVKANAGSLAIPVLIYIIIISSMFFLATMNFIHSGTVKSLFIAIGAFLFVLSDLILATDKFIKPIEHDSVFVWGLYAPGQLFIALSCFYL